MGASSERARRLPAAVDYPAAIGLCLFAFTYFMVLLVIAQHAEPGTTEEQRRTLGITELAIIGATFLALGSHAAALAWTRRHFRRLGPGMLLGLEGVIAALSAALTLLIAGEGPALGPVALMGLLGPANVTLAVYGLVNALKSRHERVANRL